VLETTGAALEGGVTVVEVAGGAGLRGVALVFGCLEGTAARDVTACVGGLDRASIRFGPAFAHEAKLSAAVMQATPPTNTAPPRCPRRMTLCEVTV
jgi:hypothetical protein